MDNLVFEESVNAEVPTSEFVDKQWLYVNDNNNSNYTGQIVLDTTPLANSGSYINWQESFLAIPLVLQIETSAGIAATEEVDWCLGMKNGFWQIIHSMSVEFNNGSVIQQTPFLNVFCSFKNLTSWSQEDLRNWGSVCGFYPDTAKSWVYNNNTTAASILNLLNTSGTGICNNRNAPYVQVAQFGTTIATSYYYNTTTTASTSSSDLRSNYNDGLYRRQSWLNFNLTQTPATPALTDTASNQAALLATSSGVLTSSGLNAIFMSYVQQAAAQKRVIVFDAVVRLKDITDFFNKCPLLKGSTMRMYINTNQTYFTGSLLPSVYTTAASGVIISSGISVLTSTPTILGGGGTNPVMVSSMDIGQGSYPIVPLTLTNNPSAATTYSVGLSIVRTQFSALTTYSAPVTSVRLYAPAYTMSPISEQRYLSLSPTKKIVYNDIFQFQYSSVSSGSFSFLVTNGIPNVRSVLVIPFLPKASNGTAQTYNTAVGTNTVNVAGITTSSLLSPFSTSGATPDPISLTNFQIQVSGKNLFNTNLQYDFESFYEQLASSNQLNGGLTTSMASGLIGKEDFQWLYRYYYGNCSRSIPSEDGVAKAIQILGTNNSSVTIDLMVFVEFQREITVDVRTGARIA
jgi:hypothetical protein